MNDEDGGVGVCGGWQILDMGQMDTMGFFVSFSFFLFSHVQADRACGSSVVRIMYDDT